MAPPHRLSSLQVRVARQYEVDFLFGPGDGRFEKVRNVSF